MKSYNEKGGDIAIGYFKKEDEIRVRYRSVIDGETTEVIIGIAPAHHDMFLAVADDVRAARSGKTSWYKRVWDWI